MFGKWIRCQVSNPSQKAFDEAQCLWSSIARCRGFKGQFGGFHADFAMILALWEKMDDYQHFMSNTHDEVMATSSQHQTYSSLEAHLLERVMVMPGAKSSFSSAIPTAEVLRIADCLVHENRVADFIDRQHRIWAPGMAQAPGMLASLFWSFIDQPNRFLVSTLWRSQKEHDNYATSLLPKLRATARPDRDLIELKGCSFKLNPRWTVVP